MSKGRHTTTSTRTFMPPPEPAKKPKKKLSTPKPKITLPTFGISSKIAWLLVIVLAASCIFMYVQYREAQDKIQNAKINNTAQADGVIKSVSKLVIVPTHETPTVATVTNAEKVKNQEFFANAKDGDKVLVYSKQKKAILYRPSTNQIVNINTVTAVQNTDKK